MKEPMILSFDDTPPNSGEAVSTAGNPQVLTEGDLVRFFTPNGVMIERVVRSNLQALQT